jgi:hypothetical protein
MLLLLLLSLMLHCLQALWARKWLSSHANVAAMQPGWTYMFEAVYQHNTHVVRYLFEGLVLLGAVSPKRAELPDAAARQQLAAQLSVMAVPSIEGARHELLRRLGRGCCLYGEAQDSTSTAASKGDGGSSSSNRSTGNFEGWVVQSEQQRCKLVLQQFQRLSRAASHLHPLMVWDAVFRGRSRAQLAEGLPVHFAAELDAMLAALDGQFWAVQKLLDQQLQKAWLGSSAMSGGSGSGSGAAVPTPDAAPAPAGEADAIPASHAERLPAAEADDGTATGEVSSVTVSAGVLGTTQFADALNYAVDKGTAAVADMFRDARTSSSSGSSPARALRGRILECIRPGLDGSLPGYTPSPAFKQTYAKGWAKGPPAGCRVSSEAPGDSPPLIMQQLTEQALAAVLGKLQGRDVGSALRVCRAWCDLVQGDPELRAAAEKAAAERKKVDKYYSSYRCIDSDEYDDYRSDSDYYDYLYRDYGGYGSP